MNSRGSLCVLAMAIAVSGSMSTACQKPATPAGTGPAVSSSGGAPNVGAPPTPGRPPTASGPTTAAGTSQTLAAPTSSTPSTPTGSAIALAFTGLTHPAGIAVGNAVYVADSGNNRVVMLAGNAPTQSALPFPGLNAPSGISVYNSNLFVSDASGSRVLWANAQSDQPKPPWQAGPDNEWLGPFTGLQNPRGVIFGMNSYTVVDSGNNRVLHWASGMNSPEVVPFAGLNNPDGLAQLPDGPVVADTGNNRVVHVRHTDAINQVQDVLGFTGLSGPHGVAVDGTGRVYVTDSGNNRVVRLTIDPNTHAATQSILPFAGLDDPTDIKVDAYNNVYVVDTGNNRILKLDSGFNH